MPVLSALGAAKKPATGIALAAGTFLGTHIRGGGVGCLLPGRGILLLR